VMFTAALTDRRDLVVARASATGTFVDQSYGFELATNLEDKVAGAFAPDGTLRTVYSNEDVTNSTVGGVFYTSGPGANVLIDDGGLLGRANDPDIAISADGRMHVAYFVTTPPSDRRIAVATGDEAFAIAPALVDANLAGQIDIALDPGGLAHVASIDTASNVVYADELSSGQWSPSSTVTNNGGNAVGSSLAVSSNGTVQMTRVAPTAILHIFGTSAEWQVASFTNDQLSIDPDYTAIAAKVDSDARVAMAWADPAGSLWFEAMGTAPVKVIATQLHISDIALAYGPTGTSLAFAVGPSTAGSPVQIYEAHCD
jgi:hypothetical protein